MHSLHCRRVSLPTHISYIMCCNEHFGTVPAPLETQRGDPEGWFARVWSGCISSYCDMRDPAMYTWSFIVWLKQTKQKNGKYAKRRNQPKRNTQAVQCLPLKTKCFERRRGAEDVKPGLPEGPHQRRGGKRAQPELAVHGVAPAKLKTKKDMVFRPIRTPN